MFFIFTHNDQKVFEGILKQHAFKISKLINDNPSDNYSLKIFKPLKAKSNKIESKSSMVLKEMTNACDITEYCLYSLL